MITPEIPDDEKQRLEALARYEILDSVDEQEFDDITLLASQLCSTPISLISFIDGNRQWFKSKHGLEISEMPRDISFCGHAILDDQLFEIPNALEDERFACNPLVIGEPDIYFYAGMPLITPDGFKLGTLCVIDQKPNRLNNKQKESLTALARQVMRLLETRILNKLHNSVLVTTNNQMEAALEAIPDLVWIKDANGTYIKCNQSFARYMGKTKAQIIGHTEYDLFESKMADFYRENDIKVMQDQRPKSMETWLNFADGYRGLFEAIKVPVKDNMGHVIGTLSMAHDVTHRKRAEAKMRRKQEAMQTLNEITSQIFQHDFKEQVRAAVALGSNYLGLETGIVSSFKDNQYCIDISISSLDQIEEGAHYPLKETYCYQMLSRTNEHEVVAIPQLNASNTAQIKWHSHLQQQVFMGILILVNGQIHGALSFFSSTARPNAFDSSEIEFVKLLAAWISSAIQREQLSQELRNSNQRIELALEGANLGLWDWHIPSNKIILNARWYEMLGYQFEEIPPSFNTFESLLHPEDRLRVINTIHAYIRGEINTLDAEFRLQHKRGYWVWINDHGKIIERDTNGVPLRMLGTHMDITERKATEEEIKHLAFYDALTGLPNRRLLLDRLAHAMASSVRSQAHGRTFIHRLRQLQND